MAKDSPGCGLLCVGVLIVALGIVAMPNAALGKTAYVRVAGDDGADGLSPVTALATLRAGVQMLSAPGDSLVVGPGRYVEGEISPVGDGTPTKPIRIAAAPDGTTTGDPPGPVLVDAHQLYKTGFLIFGRHNLVISGFTIANATTAGIQVRGNVGGGTPSGIVIENNQIFSNGNGHIGRGVQILDAVGVVVFNNLIYANSSTGVSAGGEKTGSQGVQIVNNTIYGNPVGGVVLGDREPATGAWLINNIIAGNGGFGIDVNALSRCDYVAAYNLVADPYSVTTPRDVSDLSLSSPFLNPAGPDGVLGGDGFRDDDFSLPQRDSGQATESPAVDAGSAAAVALGLDQASTRTDAMPDGGRVDLGYHSGNAHHLVWASPPIPHTTLYVRTTGDDGNTGLSSASALRTITQATKTARALTTIVVGPGVYQEGNVGFGPLTVAGPVRVVADSSGEISGDAAGPVVVDATGFANGFLITGLCSTVIDGFAVRYAGMAGIQVDTAAHAVIRNNIVFSGDRRGIEVDDSDNTQVVNNLIYGNSTGGIQVGGGTGSQSVLIRNNTIYGNGFDAILIGLFGVPSAGARVEYNILNKNGFAGDREGIKVDPLSLPGYVAQYNINTDHYAVGTPQPNTDLSTNPQFVAPSGTDGILGADGFADDDFRLRQLAAGQSEDSPAVNYGAVTAHSVGLDTRSTRTDHIPDSGQIDLGFHYPIANGVSCGGTDGNGLVGDCNGDGRVSVDELVLSVNIALGTARLTLCPAADRDWSGTVGVDELVAAVRSALCP